MEALILSCSTGGGHNAAAYALQEEWESRGGYATVMDPYTLVSGALGRTIGNIYIRLVQKLPKLFGAVYQIGNAYRRLPFHSPVYMAHRGLEEPMWEYLQAHPCDVIITTHLFPGIILARLKARGVMLPPTIFVATDYTCIPFTEETDSDYYVIPSPDLVEEFASHGLSNLMPFGIPVHQAFRQGTAQAESERETNREAALARLNLPSDRKYLLLAGGSMGAGNLRKQIAALQDYLYKNPSYVLIVICGSNETLYKRLMEQYGQNPQIQLLSYTSQFADYMAAAEILLSKPGGITSTEAAAYGIPLIHTSPIPGCETRNARFYASRNMSIQAAPAQMSDAVERLSQADIANQMIQAQHGNINPNAAVDICDFAMKCASERSLSLVCPSCAF